VVVSVVHEPSGLEPSLARAGSDRGPRADSTLDSARAGS